MFINYDKLRSFKLNNSPYIWGVTNELILPFYRKKLIDLFPKERFIVCEANRQDKSYFMLHRPILIDRNTFEIDKNPLWQQFIKELLTKRYINALSVLSGQSLCNKKIEINLWKYCYGNWLSPHTDKEDKVFTQLFYFNHIWPETKGGALRILNSNNEEDYYEQIFPGPCRSVFLKRCLNSWHSVSLQTCKEQRNVLQIVFKE